MKKPRNTKEIQLEEFEDGSGYEISFRNNGWISKWNWSTKKYRDFHSRLGEILDYVESRYVKTGGSK